MHEHAQTHAAKINNPKHIDSELNVFILKNVIEHASKAETIRTKGEINLLYLSPVSAEYVYFAKSFMKFVFFMVARIGKSPIVPLVRLSALSSFSTHTIACRLKSFEIKSKFIDARLKIRRFPRALNKRLIIAKGA